MSFCDRLWRELGSKIAQIVYDSEEENKEKGAIIYEKNGKLIMGSVVTGTEYEIAEGWTTQKELGNEIGMFHTHPAGFFLLPPEEEHSLALRIQSEEMRKLIEFSPSDLIAPFVANTDVMCVVGGGFALRCITGIKKVREKIKLAPFFDFLRKGKMFPKDVEELGLNICIRDISQAVYKVAREAIKSRQKILD